ncbi:cadherin EGF LAG seven-pass G-type receptor 2-like [Parambassis ranga]|uniref:Cadherin EGF LAG seven-pass G-type receptor 2-like n=1 Tax=Parambassis ranga TaxID=210632 RepID=A0A6P7HQA5_9TELE|nr:cadherin EGF LAG seven-pass G-type receptor 2-like [Parambassis ranga]
MVCLLLQYNNARTLKINDLNDNSPIFEKTHYATTVSETQSVDTEVLRVKAVDADSTAANNRVTYSMEPPSEAFVLINSGAFILKRRLNYNQVKKYNFTVTAQDNWGLSDTASVVIDVEDFDNLNPFFSHSLYHAFIPENQAGVFRTIQPEAIKAQDGDTGINMTLTYSITSVSPEKYERNFGIDTSSGVLSVVTAIDRDEMDSSLISVYIKAAQADDSLKTAVAVVSVTVEDVNDNVPEFDQASYSVTLLENSPVDTVVFKTVVTDLDQGGFVGTLQIVPESAPFSISSDGTVRVKNSTALDREATEKITFQIEARERDPPNNAVTAQVSVTLLDENDNNPTFTSSVYEGKVFANQTVGMLLVQVLAEDPDDGVNGQIKYTIDFGNHERYFSMDENTGEISLAETIPLQENRILEFPLYITARDGGSISRSSSAQVNIRAPGSSKPQFLQKIYTGTVKEEQDPGVTILRVDFLAIPAESPVTLRVEKESDNFAISSTVDHVTDGLRSTAQLNITVLDYNDNAPQFPSIPDPLQIPEGRYSEETPREVFAIVPTDADLGLNGEVTISLSSPHPLFKFREDGMLLAVGDLDRERRDSYDLVVRASDKGTPQRQNTTTIRVSLIDVNDNRPEFSSSRYVSSILLKDAEKGKLLLTMSATDQDIGNNSLITYRRHHSAADCHGQRPHTSVFSIAPYKTPIVYVKASDPDVGEEGQLVYSLSGGSSHFDVELSSGLVYVVSAAGLAGQTAAVEVKATDPRGLSATARVEVAVQGSASSSNLVIISLNRPANTVEKKVPELEKSLGKALGWTVNIIQVSSANGGTPESRMLRESVRTLVSFVAVDGGEAVSSEEVIKRLQSQSAAVMAELTLVFGEGLHFDIETKPETSSSDQAVVIALGVLLGLSMLGLIITSTLIIR